MHQSRVSLILLAALALVACAETEAPATVVTDSDPALVDAVIARQTADLLRQQPHYASFVDADTELAGGAYAARLPSFDAAAMARLRETEASAASVLETIDRAGLDDDTALDLDIVAQVHRYYAGIEGIEYGYIDYYFGHQPYIVNQVWGPHIDVPNIMQTQQRLGDAADMADYVARLQALGPMLMSIDDKVRSDAALGVVPPTAIIDGSVRFLDGITEAMAIDHPLVVALDERTRELGLDEDVRQTQLAAAAVALETSVYPAYRALAATMRELRDHAPEGDGIWAQPDGEAYYAQAVRFLGDTDQSPDEIHAVGLAEVERISAQMDALLRAEGYTEGSVGERMAAMGAEARFLYPDTDAGRAELLASLNTQIEEIMALMPQHFGTLPPQAVEVRRIPVESQDSSPGGYYTNPSLDGTRPGIYWINLRDLGAWPSFGLPTLTYHEAVPGHHFQIALGMDQQDLPFLRKTAPYNAFIEGWALYSELVAWELGLYADDPYGDLGRLQSELFRAVRLVVDTGLHHKRWSREQAIEYMADVTGNHASEVVPEIERYMAWPGQALGYKLGMLRIVALRDRAREALGDRFDIRAFHDVVLLAGPVPMAVLEQRVDDWIDGGG